MGMRLIVQETDEGLFHKATTFKGGKGTEDKKAAPKGHCD